MAIIHIFALSLLFVLQASCKECKTQPCLRRLYNSRVTRAEYWIRPLSGSGSSGSSGPSSGGGGWWRGKRSFDYYLRHAGVVVTVENGDRWLIHKGSDYGDSSDTVITDAGYMSRQWSQLKSKSLSRCSYTVNMFMQNALISKPYKLIGANCQTAANKMWDLVKRC
ncbi:uncharacterized protein LOC134245748 [Saccostrea cucullata]|uniref:uncharacterized protein LOC134245748 n=1 Tax=Saccostrea cuccullata TaxID=36930 RepID=UPI002ED4F570